MITASKAILSQLEISTDKLFLNGWSQGAIHTLWLARDLQKNKVPVSKQASASTFSDINKSLDWWMGISSGYGHSEFFGDPTWMTGGLALLIGSYENYYNIKGLMAQAFRPEYLKIAREIYNGKLDWDNLPVPKPGEGVWGLPLTGPELLNKGFITQFKNKKGTFYKKVQENTVLETKLSHPSRFYGGKKDYVVAEGVSVDLPTEFLAPLAEGFYVGDNSTHRSTFLGSVFGGAADPSIDILTWFDPAL